MSTLQTKLEASKLPRYMHGGIIRWIENGIPPGNFLSAVLCNDLKEACGRADDENRYLLFDYVSWFYNNAPAGCWGSPVRFHEWAGMHAEHQDSKAVGPAP